MTETKKANQEKLREVTTGLETIVGEKPTIEIEGETYTMRRLGMQDTFKVARIIGIGVQNAAGMVNFSRLTQETMAIAMFAALPFADKQILDLLASVVGVSTDEIRDPDLFPMGSEIDIINALMNHQDLKAFFTRLQGLAENNPVIMQMMMGEDQSKEQ